MINEGSESLHLPTLASGALPSGWTWRRLDSVCLGVFDCPHSTPKLSESGPLMARSQDIRSGTFRCEQAAHVSEETYLERVARAEPRWGDLLYSREGTYFGIAADVPPDQRICLGQRMVLIRPDANVLHHRYLRYWLNSPTMKAHIDGHRDGSVAERLNLPTIRALPICTPPLAAQRQIAEVLGALDDKIELNRRMNETLEAMARALFKSWFVDFDPVRAKMAGRAPFGMDAATVALFPDSLEQSDLGELPKGWSIGKVQDLATFSRSSLTPSDFPEEIFDHYSLPAFDEGRTPTAEPGGAIKSNKLVVPRDVVLISKLNPHIPRIWLPRLHSSRRSICSTEFMVASPRTPGASREALFSLFTSPAFVSGYISLVTGTTGSHQRIAPEALQSMKVVIPPPAFVSLFTKLTKPTFDQINANIDQCHTLAELRDLLLPKLLSGELRIRDAEREVENVA